MDLKFGKFKSLKCWLPQLMLLVASHLNLFNASAQGAEHRLNVLTGTISAIGKNDEYFGPNANVVVFLEGGPGQSLADTDKPIIQVSHRNQQFSPEVLPIVVGTTLDFFNDDNIYHNVFSLSQVQSFDLGIYPFGTVKQVTFNNPGLVRLYCNIHPNMVSNVLILSNSLYAVSDTDGKYEISGIPDGNYTIRVWHRFGDELSRTVTFKEGQSIESNFTVEQSTRVDPHDNKFGRPYPTKY